TIGRRMTDVSVRGPWILMHASQSGTRQLWLAGVAAFCTYFCVYAFRKPFTAGTFEGQELFGFALKAILVIAQLLGYMASKFIGIRVISETRREYRALALIALVLVSELALVGFEFVPAVLKPLMLFLNGLPLGLTFGLVLAYLEGRAQTEALSAALCASFITSSGVVKSVGRWLIQDMGVSEYRMPFVTGLIFLLPLLASVWLLQATPQPNEVDRRLRRERDVMGRAARRQFVSAYWPGLALLVFVYSALTVIRTIRDDFAVEIWRDMGVSQTPSVFARAEIIVAVCVTALNALSIWVRNNQLALRITTAMMCGAFALVGASALLQAAQRASPFAFMVASGIGLYIPYVAFHTTVFERLIAVARHPCNLGFLMYLADSIGYLGYAVVILLKTAMSSSITVLPFFIGALEIVAALSIVALLLALFWLERRLASDRQIVAAPGEIAAVEELAPAE
ncbi:MAG TPA: DUF5690 family protein, partial [Planctomycetaceae bacterium]|nr:DUF5690 family protein [Planctomycetaceae bacterium]